MGHIKSEKKIRELVETNQFSAHQLRKDAIIIDKNLALSCAVQNSSGLMSHLSAKLRNDKDVVAAMVSNAPTVYLLAGNFADDEDITRLAVQRKGILLMAASKRLADNKNIVKIAVKNDALALLYASDRLKEDPELLQIAVQNDLKEKLEEAISNITPWITSEMICMRAILVSYC